MGGRGVTTCAAETARDQDCRGCALYAGNRSVCVPHRGPLNSDILLVGEAPGVEEDANCLPFVGYSGQFLDACLLDAGIKKVCFRNVVNCHPPSNREPRLSEVKACLPYLLATIRDMRNLKVIVALGNVPMRALTGKSGIVRRVGTPLLCKHTGHTVYPVFHPAYVLRRLELKDRFIQLLMGIKPFITGVDDDFVKTVEGEEGRKCVERFTHYTSPVAFDLETTGLDPTRNSLLSVSFYGGRGKPTSVSIDTPETLRALRAFMGSDVGKVVHNVAFESAWAELHLGTPLRNVVADTLLLGKRDLSYRPANLGAVAAAFVPEVGAFKMDSEWALERGELWSEMDPHTLLTRNAIDSYVPYKIWKILARKLGPEIMKIHREVDVPTAIAMSRVKHRGLAIDMEKLLGMEEREERRADKAVKAARLVGIHASLSSPTQLASNFEELGLHTGMFTDTGQMATGEAALLRLKEFYPHTSQWVDPILEYRSAKKFNGTYVKGFAKHISNGIVRGEMRAMSTQSWRPTCSQPNLLNLPRGPFREVVVSRFEGGRIVKADYNQAELRTVASLSQDPEMLKIYRDGLDIHTNTARSIFGVSRVGTEMRSTAKAVNFGIIYGMGEATLQQQLRSAGIHATLSECHGYIKAWRAEYAVAWEYMLQLQKEVGENACITSPQYGITRHFDFSTVQSEEEMTKLCREGANHPVQCAAVMVTMRAVVLLDDALDEEEGILINCPYDELVVDTPTNGTMVGSVVKSCMIQAAEEQEWLAVPFTVDVEVGPSWGALTPL